MQTKTTIPTGWKKVILSDIAFINKESLDSNTPENFSFKYLDLASISYGKVTIPRDGIQYSKAPSRARRKIKSNDVLMATVRPNLLGHAIVDFDPKNIICSTGFAVIETKKNVLNSYFIYSYLFTDKLNNIICNMLVGSNYPAINSSDVAAFEILLPPLPEQEKIVEVLEAWDSYLEKLTHSIRLKKKIKKGLMEKLLTGKVFLNADSVQNKKTRYFRIPKHWQIVSISEVANEVSKKNTANINLPVLSCTKHAGLVDSLKFFKKQIFSKKLDAYKVVDIGQFAYATNHIEEGSIGLQNLYDSGLVSPMYTVFKTDKQKILDDYLFPLLKTVLFRHIFKAKTSSSVNRRGSLRWKSFSKIEIPLPPMNDQEKIAHILTTADRDIEALEKKKSLVEQQKKFLLNNLITGRIRLPEFSNHFVDPNKMV